MTPREIAQKALRTHLRCDGKYVLSLLQVLNEGEREQIAAELENPGGAVAIAAVIYKARLRLACEEADRHHQTILDTVPLEVNRADAVTPRRRMHGIRECPLPQGFED